MLSSKLDNNKEITPNDPLIGIDDDPLTSDLMILMNREKIPVSLVRIKEPIIVSVFKSAYSEDRQIFKENNQQHYNPHFQPEDAFLVDAVFYDAPISSQLIGILDIFTTLSGRANYTNEAEFNKRVIVMFADLEKKFAAEERAKALAEGRIEFDTPASPTDKKKKKEKVVYIEPFELRILPIVHCAVFKSGENNHVNICVSRGSSAALWTTTPNNSPSISPSSSPARSPLHTREGGSRNMNNISPPSSREGRDNNRTISRGDGIRNSFSNSISPPGSRERGSMSPSPSRGDKLRLSSGLLDEFGFASQPFHARKIPPKDYKAKSMKMTQVLLEARNVSSRNMLKWTTQIYATLIALARNYITFNGELTINDIILIPDKSVLQSLRESQLKATGPRDVLDKDKGDVNAPKKRMNKAEKERILKEKRKVKAFIKAEEEEITKIKESRFERDAWIDPHFCLSKFGSIQKLKQRSKFVNVQEDDDIHGFVNDEEETTDDSTVESNSTDNDNIDNDSIGQSSHASLQSLNTKYALSKVQKDTNSNFKFPSKFTVLSKYDNTKKVATCVCHHYDTIPKVHSQYKVFFNGIVKDMRSVGTYFIILMILNTNTNI